MSNELTVFPKTDHSDRRLRVLLVGEYVWPWYQEACATALEQHGCDVVRFGWLDDFRRFSQDASEPIFRSFWRRIQHRLGIGPTVWRVYARLLKLARASQPDIVWFYNVQLIAPSVVRAMKKDLPGATFVQYANDNPFSSDAKRSIWRYYLSSIPLFDKHFSYRHSNIEDYRRYGATSVHLLRSYFIREEDFPVPQEEIPDKFKCDVVFAGHYEDDGRVEVLEAICDAGYRLNLFGGGWNAALSTLREDSPLRSKYPIAPAIGADYRYAICGAKVALCFLSTLNRDTYTRRNFQIPAMEVAMLSQYTDDLAEMYEADREAVFFKNQRDLLCQLERLVNDDAWRRAIAHAGYKKVYSAGHDVRGRIGSWLQEVCNVR